MRGLLERATWLSLVVVALSVARPARALPPGFVEENVGGSWNEVAGLTFQYRNAPEFDLLAHEIFEGGEYEFPCNTDAPIILDCGSHIGLSVAWFKRRFPKARITAFEPDPQNFELLQANVAANGFEGVELLNLAHPADQVLDPGADRPAG